MTQKATRALQVAAFCESVNTISNRLDALEHRRAEAAAAQAKADEDEEQRRIRQFLDSLPDPDAPEDIHFNAGDLHDLPPTQDQGALPNQLREGAPPESRELSRA